MKLADKRLKPQIAFSLMLNKTEILKDMMSIQKFSDKTTTLINKVIKQTEDDSDSPSAIDVCELCDMLQKEISMQYGKEIKYVIWASKDKSVPKPDCILGKGSENILYGYVKEPLY